MKVLKVILFLVGFYVFSLGLAFLLRDDANTYTRLVMHDFQSQENVDVLFCGASHVSHGILPEMLDELIGKSTCNSGTPNQELVGTYAMIKAATEMYDLEEIFVDLDFRMVMRSEPFNKQRYTPAEFLTGHYLKNPKVKLEYILSSTSPKYYLNAFFPLGIKKTLVLNPKKVYKNLKSKLTGEYYEYKLDNGEKQYHPKGCVFEFEFVEKGTFSSGRAGKIDVSGVSPDIKKYLQKIMALCEEKNIRLSFCSYPMSDFLLASRKNYDEFYSAMKKLLNGLGHEFYDFNLMKAEWLSLEDEDFNDDEHLNDKGIKKFTLATANLLKTSPESRNALFYETYQEKLNHQSPRILGVMFEENGDRSILNVIPVLNNGEKENIFWKVCVESDGEEKVFIEKTSETAIAYPKNTVGKLKIYGYYGDEQQTCSTKFFNTR